MKQRPRIGDIVELKTATSKGRPLRGVTLNVRTHKDGFWSAVELLVNGQRRWFTRGDVAGIVGRPPGISRIDQPTRRTHGWFVRLHYHGKSPRLARLFSDQKYQGIERSFQAALEFYQTNQEKGPQQAEHQHENVCGQSGAGRQGA